MTQIEEKQRARMEKDLAIPRWKYIVSNGIAWGISVSVLLFLVDWIIHKKSPASQWAEGFWMYLLIMPFAGLLYGWMVRTLLERRYRKLKSREENGGRSSASSS